MRCGKNLLVLFCYFVFLGIKVIVDGVCFLEEVSQERVTVLLVKPRYLLWQGCPSNVNSVRVHFLIIVLSSEMLPLWYPALFNRRAYPFDV